MNLYMKLKYPFQENAIKINQNRLHKKMRKKGLNFNHEKLMNPKKQFVDTSYQNGKINKNEQINYLILLNIAK